MDVHLHEVFRDKRLEAQHRHQRLVQLYLNHEQPFSTDFRPHLDLEEEPTQPLEEYQRLVAKRSLLVLLEFMNASLDFLYKVLELLVADVRLLPHFLHGLPHDCTVALVEGAGHGRFVVALEVNGLGGSTKHA